MGKKTVLTSALQETERRLNMQHSYSLGIKLPRKSSLLGKVSVLQFIEPITWQMFLWHFIFWGRRFPTLKWKPQSSGKTTPYVLWQLTLRLFGYTVFCPWAPSKRNEPSSGPLDPLCWANILVVNISICNQLSSVTINLVSWITDGDGYCLTACN